MAAATKNNKSIHKIAIQRNLVYLTANTVDFDRLLTTLVSKFTLTYNERDEIKSCKTDLERYIELYTKIYKKDENAFKNLCDALKETHNTGPLSKLTNDNNFLELEESDEVDLLSGAKIPGSMMMKFYQRRNIFRHFNYITESTMHLLEVILHLEQVDVLTLNEHKKILSWRTDRCRNAALYLALLKKKPNPFVKLIKVLRETNNGKIADKLESTPEEDDSFENEITNIKLVFSRMRLDEENFLISTVPDNIWFGMRERIANDKFIGREDILESLQKSIKSQEEEAKSNHHSKFTVLCGLPGVGKSETLREYVYIHHSKDNVIWINAENVLSISEAFKKLAQEHLYIDICDSKGQKKDIQGIVTEVYENLSDRRCIFVFDNAENTEEFRNENSIDKFLPILQPTHRRPFVIVTSQNKYWSAQGQTWEKIEIDVFTKAESTLFITERLQIKSSESETKNEVENLSLAMRGHPLALTQAVEYISRENSYRENDGGSYDVSEFLKYFEEKEKEILDHNPFLRSSGKRSHHLVTVFATWKLSVEGIMKTEDSGEMAIEILNIMAYYNSYGIHSTLFRPMFSDRRKLGMILGILRRYSLITCSNGIIDIHGLFQQVSRIELQQNKRDGHVLEIAMELLNRFMPQDSTSFLRGDDIAIPHAVVAWEYAISYPKIVSKYHEDIGMIIVENIRNGCYSKAIKFSEEAVMHLSNEFGATNEQVMRMRTVNILAIIRIGNNEAVAKQMKILMTVAKDKLDRGVLQPKDDVEAIAIGHIRKLANFNGSEKELIHITKEAIAKMTEEATKQNNDEDDWTPFALQLFQAALLEQSGQHEESLKLLQTAIKAIEKFLGSDHALTLKAKTTIAGVLSSLGRTEEALHLLSEIRALENSKNITPLTDGERQYVKLLTSDDDALFRQIKGNVLGNAGKHDDALKALGYQENQNPGPSTATDGQKSSNSKPKAFVSADILQTNVIIVKNLISQGKYTEALTIAEENYQISIKQFGKSDNTTISLACVFIWALDRLERFDEALDLSQNLFDTLSSTFGDDNEITTSILLMIPELIEKRDKHLQKSTPAT